MHPIKSHKDTGFHRGRIAVSMDFSAGEISSDGVVPMLQKLERKHRILRYFSNVDSLKLKRILKRIRAAYPDIKIAVRADSGFSCPAFYQLADDFNLQFVIGQATNETLKRKTARAEKGINARHIISNMEEADARLVYFGFYVKRGDTSENGIKEIKNMCFSDRLSDHDFWANFLRLFISSLAYEMFLLLKGANIYGIAMPCCEKTKVLKQQIIENNTN